MRDTVRGISLVCCAAVMAALSPPAVAAPIADGWLDPTEGYGSGYTVDYALQDSALVVTGGELWTYQGPGVGGSLGDVYIYFSQPKTLVDNTYGANSIGWGSDSLTGKDHKFSDLLGSDKASLTLKDGDGNIVYQVTLDYIRGTSKKKGDSGPLVSMGMIGGGGKVAKGCSPGAVLAAGSSLAYNLNTLGYLLTVDSPQTDTDYTPNSEYPDWIYEVAYEVQVDGDVFGDSGFGGVEIIVHNSPNKLTKKHVAMSGEITLIPEPTTFGILAFGGLGVLLRRRRR